MMRACRGLAATLLLAGLSACAEPGFGPVGVANPYGPYGPRPYAADPYAPGPYGPPGYDPSAAGYGFWGPGVVGGGYYGAFGFGGRDHPHWDRDHNGQHWGDHPGGDHRWDDRHGGEHWGGGGHSRGEPGHADFGHGGGRDFHAASPSAPYIPHGDGRGSPHERGRE